MQRRRALTCQIARLTRFMTTMRTKLLTFPPARVPFMPRSEFSPCHGQTRETLLLLARYNQGEDLFSHLVAYVSARIR